MSAIGDPTARRARIEGAANWEPKESGEARGAAAEAIHRAFLGERRQRIVTAEQVDAELWERIVLSLIAGKCYTDDDINIDNLRKDAADVLTVIKAGPPRSEP